MENLYLENFQEKLKRSDQELNVLYEVSCAMRTTLDLKHILHIILTSVTSHSGLGYNRAILFLVNPTLHCLECKIAIGPESGEHAEKIWEYIAKCNQNLEDLINADKMIPAMNQSILFKSLKDIRIPLTPDNSSLLAQAFYRGSPWHLPPERIEDFRNDILFQKFQSQEMIIMPLRAKGNVNGLIIADNLFTKKPISAEEIRIFTMLADQAALAIENSRLYELTVQKSQTDPVTNLWNHGFFQDNLSKELELTKAAGRPLSLAIIDIDDFKKLNDQYGHQEGDRVLKEIANLLKESSREKDRVCRYGGEEFSIILTETSKAQSYDIAERLRSKIENRRFFVEEGKIPQQVTVSIGLATFPDDSDGKKDLIENADRSMYIAKFSGKNKTCVTEPS